MKSILPNSRMPFEQKCLLFTLEKEIIEQDLEYSKQNDNIDIYEAKCTWFQCWKEIINKEIKKIESIDNLNKTVLYNTIREQKNTNKWEKEIFNQCETFNPYKIQDLIEIGKCSNHDDLIGYKEKEVFPILNLNSQNRQKILDEIRIFLNHYK